MLDRYWLQCYTLSRVSVNGQTGTLHSVSSDNNSPTHSYHCLTVALDQRHMEEPICLSASCGQTAPLRLCPCQSLTSLHMLQAQLKSRAEWKCAACALPILLWRNRRSSAGARPQGASELLSSGSEGFSEELSDDLGLFQVGTQRFRKISGNLMGLHHLCTRHVGCMQSPL